jgi:uncharacterized protein (TIGR00269 family)
MQAEFIERFEEKVKGTIKEYGLVNKKDKVVVACSGGKDSTTTLYLLHKFGYDVEALTIDLNIGEWSDKNLKNIRGFCERLGVKLDVLSMREEYGCSICYIRSGIQSKKKLGNCSICGVIKRWLLNKRSRELGATKLATGHNLDDEAETVLMTLFKGNPEIISGSGPITAGVKDRKFVPRIKPLYFCTNDEVRRYSKAAKFPVLYDPCPCSVGTYRIRIRKWLAGLARRDPEIKANIVRNFLALLPILRKDRKPGKKMKYCRICQEPSRNDVCKRCQLMNMMSD